MGPQRSYSIKTYDAGLACAARVASPPVDRSSTYRFVSCCALPQTLSMSSTTKPRTRAGKRALQKREPKLEENPKRLLVLRASKTSQVAIGALRSLARLKAPLVTVLRKRNEVRPFELGGEGPLEFLLQRNDCSLFAIATHAKKRPHGLVLGRSFDGRVLDMIEVGVESLKTPEQDTEAPKRAGSIGSKPCLCFLGDAWAKVPHGERLRNLFLDFFRAYDLEEVNLAGIDQVIVLVAQSPPRSVLETVESDGCGDLRILFRHYLVRLKKRAEGDVRLPLVRLEPAMPWMDWRVRRTRFASDALMRQTMPTQEQLRAAAGSTLPRREKNVKYDPTRLSKVGKVYLPRQSLETLELAPSARPRKRIRTGTSSATSPAGTE